MHSRLPIVIFGILAACTAANDNKNITQQKTIDKQKVENNIRKGDTTYLPYLIDTGLVFNDLRKLINYKNSKQDSLLRFIDKRESKSAKGADIKFAADSIMSLNQQYFSLLMRKYILASEKNIITLRCLYMIANSPVISESEILSLFSLFPEELQKSVDGKKVILKLNKFKKNIGFEVNKLNAKLINSYGSEIAFSGLFEKPYEYYVLIFGASWCQPCKYGNMVLKKEIHGFDTNKVRFLDISMDTDKMKWTKSIEENKLLYEHFLLRNNFQSEVASKLNITGVPRIFLIDKSYKIISEHTDIKEMLKKISGSDYKVLIK